MGWFGYSHHKRAVIWVRFPIQSTKLDVARYDFLSYKECRRRKEHEMIKTNSTNKPLQYTDMRLPMFLKVWIVVGILALIGSIIGLYFSL
jgi:hypothetical protein